MRKTAFEPCLPTRGTKVPPGPEWLHEIKHDGYRLIVQRVGAHVRLFTRNGHDWTARYPLIVEAAPWVINGPDDPEIRLPLYPRKRTQVGHLAMSVSCH